MKSHSDGSVKTYSSSEKADKEISKLKKQKQQIQAEVNQATGPDKKAKLEEQLKSVENELSLKDTDSYRRANATFWEA